MNGLQRESLSSIKSDLWVVQKRVEKYAGPDADSSNEHVAMHRTMLVLAQMVAELARMVGAANE